MQRHEFANVMTWLSVAVGKPIGDTDEERRARMDVYFDCLGDLPIDVLQIAAKRVAMSHPWPSFPSVAELRQAAAQTLQGHVQPMSGGEAWQLAWAAACKIDPERSGPYMTRNKAGQMELFDSQLAAACEGMPPLVIEAMRCFGITALCNADANFARPQFIKIFESLAARDNGRVLLPESVKRAIDDKRPLMQAAALIGRIPSPEAK